MANKRKLVLCVECEQLKIRRLSLGRQYSKALARAFDARDTTRYVGLAEAADVLRTRFKQIQAEISNHRTLEHRRGISPASASISHRLQAQTLPAADRSWGHAIIPVSRIILLTGLTVVHVLAAKPG